MDVGRLKDALEAGLSRFNVKQIRERWKEDVFCWMVDVIRGWVQRCKLIRLRLRGRGIRVELQTQDDHGYYSYAFDVFPGATRARTARRHWRARRPLS